MYYYVHVHVHVHVYQYFIFSALKIFYAAIRNDNGYRPDSPELMKVIQCVCVCVCVCVCLVMSPLLDFMPNLFQYATTSQLEALWGHQKQPQRA